MAIYIDCEQRSPEWYAARCGVLTASACEDIMTPARRKSFVSKMIAEIVTGKPDSFPMNEYMEWGVKYEDEAREAYEKHTDTEVKQTGFVYYNEDKLVGCSPDGLVGKAGLIEIKCPMTKTHIQYLQEGEPKKYFMQMQFQMMVTGKIWCDFVSYDPRLPESMRLFVCRVERDPLTINRILASIESTTKEIDEFLNKYDVKRGSK